MPEVTIGQVVAQLVEYGDVAIPYWQVTSEHEGPDLLVTAAQHGCEVQGCEVARRLVEIAGEGLQRGSMTVVPFANPPALWKRRHHISSAPERDYGEADGHNMNLTWPGKADGNDTERLSHAISTELIPQASHHIDIHCWSKFTAATALPREDRLRSLEFAAISGLPFAQPRPGPAGATETQPVTPNTIGAYFNDTGRASMTFELCGQYIILEQQVRLGLRCVVNVARFLGMLEGDPEGLDEGPVWMERDDLVTVTAPVNGLFVETGLATADWVEEGQKLGHIIGDDLAMTEVFTPVGGRLFRYGCHRAKCDVALPAMHPYASEGDVLAEIVEVEENGGA